MAVNGPRARASRSVSSVSRKLARRRVAIPVEAGLSDGGGAARCEQPRDAIPLVAFDLRDVVGMDAGGAGDAGLAGCELGGGFAVGSAGADHGHAGHARRPRPREHIGQITAEAHRVEMAVAVEEFHQEAAACGREPN
jgi:hypothetical protein